MGYKDPARAGPIPLSESSILKGLLSLLECAMPSPAPSFPPNISPLPLAG